MKKIVGKVSVEERDQIQILFKRKMALRELSLILTKESSELYERLIADIADNEELFQGWWDRMANKYQWERTPHGHWSIDFESCDIILVDNE